MESKANYTLIGLIVVLLTAGLIISALWLSVGFDQKQYNTYAVYLREAVSGLSDDAPVKYSGVQVGYVKRIELDSTDPEQVRLLLAIEEGTPITVTTTATLISQGITGTTYVGLKADSSDLTPLKKPPHEPYPIIPSRPSLFNQLDNALKDVSSNINTVSLEIRRVFDKENAEFLKNTLRNLQNISDAIAKNSSHIDNVLKNGDTLITSLSQSTKDLPELTASIKKSSLAFTETMHSGKDSFELFNQQALPIVLDFMQRLNHLTANLEAVSVLMRQNPSVILRGTTPAKPGPGE